MFVGHAQLSIAVGKPLCSIGSSVSRLSLVMPFASCYSWITLYSELLQLSAYMHALSACLHAQVSSEDAEAVSLPMAKGKA